MNKTIIGTIILLLLCSVTIFAESGVKVSFLLATDFVKNPENIDVLISDPALIWYGFGWEVITDKFSFGGNYLINSYRLIDKSWVLNFDGDFFGSFHLFGDTITVIDPYIKLGLGAMGRIVQDVNGVNSGLRNLSFYPFAAGGINVLLLKPLVFGIELTVRPVQFLIPFTEFDEYPGKMFKITTSFWYYL